MEHPEEANLGEMNLVVDDLEVGLDVVERMRGSHVELGQEEVLMIEVGHHQVEVLRALKVEEGLLVLPEVELSFVEAYLLEVRHELEEVLQEACPEELRPLVEDHRRT